MTEPSLGSAVLKLGTDDTGLQKGLQKAEQDSAARMKNIGKKMTVRVTAPILAIGAAVFKATEDIDEAMATIQTGTGATGAKLQELKADFEAVHGTVPADMQTVAGAIADLNTTLGLTGPQLQDAARAAIELGDAMGVDASTAIDQTAQAMKAFGIEGQDPVAIMDKMFVVAQATNIPMDALTATLGKYGNTLAAAGLPMEDAVALTGALHEAGLPARTVMSGLGATLDKLASEGVTDMSAGLDDLIGRLVNATTDADAISIATDYFGSTAGPALANAARAGALDLDVLRASMEGADGAIMANAESTRTNTERLAMMRAEIKERLAGRGRACRCRSRRPRAPWAVSWPQRARCWWRCPD